MILISSSLPTPMMIIFMACGTFYGVHIAVPTSCGFQCIPPTHTDLKPPTVLR
jgi:hypothetical protein